MSRTAIILAALAALALITGFAAGLRGCAEDMRTAEREAGKAELAFRVQEVAHNATIAQTQRNNEAAVSWRDHEQAIARQFAEFYVDIDAVQALPVPACTSSAPEAPAWTLDSVVPAAVERDLRLRVAKTNDAVCAGAGCGGSAACAAWAEARPAALTVRGITWRRLVRYAGECLEVIALGNNDKAAVLRSLDGE